MLTPPGLLALTTPLELMVALAGDKDVQVRGGFVSCLPRRSKTVAVRVVVPPVAMANEVLLDALPTCSWMD